MKQIIVILILALLVLVPPCIASELDNSSIEHPILLASGKDYTIQAFWGQVKDRGTGYLSNSYSIRPGILIFYTDRNTAQKSLLLTTGTFQNSTANVSYTIAKLLGLYQTDTHIAAVLYCSERLSRRSPDAPPSSDEGIYYITVFEKKSGKEVFTAGLDNAPNRPKIIPEETIGIGIIKKTKTGFNVFGSQFYESADGKINHFLSDPTHK